MQKRIVPSAALEAGVSDPPGQWLALDSLASSELTSEAPGYPIEAALTPSEAAGWRASSPGPQAIRILFDQPTTIKRIYLEFREPESVRTQEYVLRWSRDFGHTFQDVVRQQWNFNPRSAPLEQEDHHVDLHSMHALELVITPDVSEGSNRASLARLLLA